jgi:hypothetical protein
MGDVKAAGRATEREVGVVVRSAPPGRRRRLPTASGWRLDGEAPLANARSKVGAANTAQLVWILPPRLPEPEELVRTGD